MEYFIHDSSTNKMIVCKDLASLIRWFANTVRADIYGNLRVGAFDKLAMNKHDTRIHCRWDDGLQAPVMVKLPRTLTVVDSFGRTVDPRDYTEQILKPLPEKRRWRTPRRPWETYVFRQGPVPKINRRFGYNWYRHPRTTQERRMGCIQEYQPFFRSARNDNNLPDAYDDITRHTTRSWKQKRIHRQWMKNLR